MNSGNDSLPPPLFRHSAACIQICGTESPTQSEKSDCETPQHERECRAASSETTLQETTETQTLPITVYRGNLIEIETQTDHLINQDERKQRFLLNKRKLLENEIEQQKELVAHLTALSTSLKEKSELLEKENQHPVTELELVKSSLPTLVQRTNSLEESRRSELARQTQKADHAEMFFFNLQQRFILLMSRSAGWRCSRFFTLLHENSQFFTIFDLIFCCFLVVKSRENV